jgi:hypothetical protein
MEPYTQPQEAIPKHNAQGANATPSFDPLSLQQTLPGMSNPVAMAMGQSPKGDGIFMLNLSHGAVEDGGQRELPVGRWETFMFVPTDGFGDQAKTKVLKVGETGTFGATLIAQGGPFPGYIGKPGSGRIVVEEFTPFMLRARVSGTFCKPALDPRARDKCESPFPVTGTITKGLAGLHMSGSKFFVEDTPGTRQYRAMSLTPLLGAGTTGGGGPGGAGPGGPGSSAPGAGAVNTKCECSCDDLKNMDGKRAEMEKLKKRGDRAAQMEAMQLAGCMARCMRFYRECMMKDATRGRR